MLSEEKKELDRLEKELKKVEKKLKKITKPKGRPKKTADQIK